MIELYLWWWLGWKYQLPNPWVQPWPWLGWSSTLSLRLWREIVGLKVNFLLKIVDGGLPKMLNTSLICLHICEPWLPWLCIFTVSLHFAHHVYQSPVRGRCWFQLLKWTKSVPHSQALGLGFSKPRLKPPKNIPMVVPDIVLPIFIMIQWFFIKRPCF